VLRGQDRPFDPARAIKTLNAILAKVRPEPMREPTPPIHSIPGSFV
jgi:hypothetical protein